MKTTHVILISIQLISIKSQVIIKGKCPKEIPDQSNFSVSKYLGKWFDFAHNDRTNEPKNAACETANYGEIDIKTISINNTEYLHHGTSSQCMKWAAGQGAITDSNYPNRLKVSFDKFGGCKNKIIDGSDSNYKG